MYQKAYCQELERDVSGKEVWELLYGERPVKKSLNFRCPDKNCGARLILRNCYPYVSCYETRFRLYPRSIHKPDCSYMKNLKEQKKLISAHYKLTLPKYAMANL